MIGSAYSGLLPSKPYEASFFYKITFVLVGMNKLKEDARFYAVGTDEPLLDANGIFKLNQTILH